MKDEAALRPAWMNAPDISGSLKASNKIDAIRIAVTMECWTAVERVTFETELENNFVEGGT